MTKWEDKTNRWKTTNRENLTCASNWHLEIPEATRLCSPQEFLNLVLGFNDAAGNSQHTLAHLTTHHLV